MTARTGSLSNLSRNTVLSTHTEIADTFLSRARGLLGRTSLADGHGLVITRCQSIHMVFMRFAIDVVFVDRQGSVVGLVRNIPPFALSPVFWSADRAIELPAGTIDRTHTRLGDTIR